MTSFGSPWPQRTTAWAGAFLLVAGFLLVLRFVGFSVPLIGTASVELTGVAVGVLIAAVRAAGFVVAALGVRGETGIAGGSAIGTIALVVFGVGDLVYAGLGLLPLAPDGAVSVLRVAVGTGVVVLTAVAALVAAVAVFRAAVLGGVARWALLPLALVELVMTALQMIPDEDLGLALAGLPTEFLEPVLLIAIGAAYLLFGRIEAVKHRAAVVNEHW